MNTLNGGYDIYDFLGKNIGCECGKKTCTCKQEEPEYCGCPVKLSTDCVRWQGKKTSFLPMSPNESLESILLKIETILSQLDPSGATEISNIGTGSQWYAGTSPTGSHQFRTIIGLNGIATTQNPNNISVSVDMDYILDNIPPITSTLQQVTDNGNVTNNQILIDENYMGLKPMLELKPFNSGEYGGFWYGVNNLSDGEGDYSYWNFVRAGSNEHVHSFQFHDNHDQIYNFPSPEISGQEIIDLASTEYVDNAISSGVNLENYYTKLESDGLFYDKTEGENLAQTVINIADGTGGKSYPSTTVAMAVDPLPADNVIFSVDEFLPPPNQTTPNPEAGVYAYDSTRPLGYRFVNSLITSTPNKELKISSHQSSSNGVQARYKYLHFERKIEQNYFIVSAKVSITRAGTFSIGRVKGVGTSSYEIVESKQYNVAIGEQVLTVNMYVNSDERLVFKFPTDTATFGFINVTPSAEGGRLSVLDTGMTPETWRILNGNLNIEITARVYLSTEKSTPLKGKTFSILGDSISTFSGFIPSGNVPFYPRPTTYPEITDYSQTYWGKLIVNDEMVLDLNQSSSGSQVVSTYGTLSFYNRVSTLVTPSDFIFLFGGTNDWFNSINIGSGDFTQPKNINDFTGSFRYVIEHILTNLPNSKLIVFVPLHRVPTAGVFPSVNSSGVSLQEFQKRIIDICNFYGVDYIRTDNIFTNFNSLPFINDGTHPNPKGFEMIYKKIKNKINELI